jgi:hypothetical protein
MMEDGKNEDFQDKVFEPYALAIGQAALAWNDLHVWLGCLLQSILYPRQGEPMDLLWNAMIQDRAARQMLRAATEYKFGGDAEKHDKIMWLLGQVDVLEDSRNNIIHTGLTRTSGGRVVVSGGTRRAANLAARPDLLAEIHWCRNTAIALRDFTLDIDRGLESVHGTLPKKPSLPNRGQKKTSPNHPRRRQS